MKTVIITGGTGGLGPDVVARLSRTYRCVLLARHADGENVLQVDLNHEASVVDAVAQAAQRFGAPYALVHMAGGYAGGSVRETSLDTWQKQLALNLTGAFLMIRETLAVMNRNEPGRIVAISSEATITKMASAAAYTISKTALNALIELTAKELLDTKITANALVPATLDTKASREAMPNAKRVPLDRVASAVEYLLSDEASNLSGALIPLRAS
ncbi:MAG TPA: SDR family NAD(P)-dependent oxidoreductase [Thermoanaerobaculia bacterium]|nr:SDR family NAD(P)-dependent oxidoreductase [Thermoanaerobaculia bacterium]